MKSVQLLRMNYILLRLAKNMKAAKTGAESKDNDSGGFRAFVWTNFI